MIVQISVKDIYLPEGITGVTFLGGDQPSSGGEQVYDTAIKALLEEAIRRLEVLQVSIFRQPPQDASHYKVAPDFGQVTKKVTEDLKVPKNGSSNLLPPNNDHDTQVKDKRFPHTFNTTGLVNLYNAAAAKNGWRQCTTVGVDLKRRLLTAIRRNPEKSYWELVIKGWEAHPFFSGKNGQFTGIIKIMTMIHKSRYEEFYEDGLAQVEKQKEHDEFFEMLNNPANYSSFKINKDPHAD